MADTRAAADLLIELGCEELPPKALDDLREALFAGVTRGLEDLQIAFDAAASRAYSSPRRLGLLIRAVATHQPDQVLDRRGPAVSAAFDASGKPTGAAQGFARSVGLEVTELDRLETDKGAWLFARVESPGRSLDELLFPLLEQVLRQLPIPRPMRWGDHDYSFVRPAHWLVALHGTRVIAGRLLGLEAGRETRGHRVHSPGLHAIAQAADYEQVLRGASVLADPVERRQVIRRQLEDADEHVLIDPALLDEVNNLVEWPAAIGCTFEAEFLRVPHAALVAAMQDHQKFFPVRDPGDATRVTHRFVAIANLESRDVQAVREGYERVIRPRLADARFFLEQDEKQPLSAYLPKLDQVVYQEKIGSIGDKCRRIADVSEKLAEILGFEPGDCRRAAELSKCDLLTQMVGEFPELQGTMGRHYALVSGEAPQVAEAIGEHYAPAYAGAPIPAGDTGRVVSIADRADSLVGIFAAGLRPTGNKDPFALRRAALGLVRILLEAGLDVPLDRILALAANALSPQIDVAPELLLDVREFVVERLRHYYREQGHGAELVSAVIASGWDSLPDLDARLRALADFMGQEAAASLAAANKRIGNILRKSGEEEITEIATDLVKMPQEKDFFDALQATAEATAPLLESRDYAAALRQLATLRAPVDAFFDAVMVMDEDLALRRNRLALLGRMKAQFDLIADLSVLG